MEAMLGNEHGGMNDVLAGLYAATGEAKYLDLSRRFNHHAVLDPLARREDKLTGLHANTQFPKIIGAARQYELTGDERCRTAATFFWDVVTKERSYVTGGNSDDEHFSPKQELSKHIGPNTTETCNTYNMLKLTRQLFGWDPRPEYADYYERGSLEPYSRFAEPGKRHGVLLPAAEDRLRETLRHARGFVLVLLGHGRGKPCQVRRQHLLP